MTDQKPTRREILRPLHLVGIALAALQALRGIKPGVEKPAFCGPNRNKCLPLRRLNRSIEAGQSLSGDMFVLRNFGWGNAVWNVRVNSTGTLPCKSDPASRSA